MTSARDEAAALGAADVLAGGGEMGALMRALDWSATPLGPVEAWPRALKTCVRIMLTSRQPMWLGWGDELTFLYNDPYRSIVGGKHPQALGQPLAVVWREIWDDVAPRIESTLRGDEGTYDEALLLIMERHGYAEETYYTFSYSPIPDDDGRVAGIFCANTDDTRRVIGERQIAMLRDLAAGTAEARTVADACALSMSGLETNPHDVPFALLYLLDSNQGRAVLAGTTRIAPGHMAAPQEIALDETEADVWPSDSAPGRAAGLGPGTAGVSPVPVPGSAGVSPVPVPGSAGVSPVPDNGAGGPAGSRRSQGHDRGPAGRPGSQGDVALTAVWPIAEVVRANTPHLVADLGPSLGALPAGSWDRPPGQAVALPLALAGQTGLAGVLVIGLNPYRLFDDDYQRFLNLVAGQIGAAIADARAYEEERHRAEALAELDRAKTAFFQNVSHEFRTPLTLSLGPVEDVLADPAESLSPQGRERLEIAHRNQLRLLRLVNTLLDFSRLEAGRTQARFEPVDLAGLTADLASVFRAAVERAGLRLVVDCPELPHPVYVDHEMWEKIVLNLLSNALKFTFAGAITVTLRAAEERVVLAVRDTGTGIPAEEVPHLFERFHRVRGARARTHEGTGIGLALVRELVTLHGGAIGVQSALGQGTTVTVTLPRGLAHLPPERIDGAPYALADATISAVAAPYVEEALRWLPGMTDVEGDLLTEEAVERLIPTRAANAEAPQARVLLADDNADMRDYLSRLLDRRYEVRAVADGTTALAEARAWQPDLVISDVMMPGLDGVALLKELRADTRTRTVPVILLSARAGQEAAIEGLDAGADDYLVKPFAARELLARVRTHMELARLRAQAEATLRQRMSQAELAAEVGAALTERATVPEQLQRCAESLVLHLDAAFARIWTLDEGGDTLVLRASAGIYTHLDGAHSRISLGALRVGCVAAERRPHLTNSVVGDPLIDDQEWARREGMVAFAGYPLVVADRLVGVMALFARHTLTDATLGALGAVANEIALGIARTWADEERAGLLAETQAAWAAAEAERQRLRDLFMQAPAIIAVLRGPRHVFEVANPLYVQAIGRRDAGEVLGRPVREALPEVERQGYFELLDQVYASGEPFVGTEMPVKLDRHGDGNLDEVLVNFVYQPYRNAQGAVEGIFAHAVEVTEQVRARQGVEELARQMQAERDRLQQVMNALPVAVVIAEVSGRFAMSNDAAAAMFGSDLPGSPVPHGEMEAYETYGSSRLDGTPYPSNELPLQRAMWQGEEVRGEQLLTRTPTGRDIPILANTVPLRDAEGQIVGAVGVFQDISTIREIERAREEFLSSAAHDLKSPLTSIRGLAQLAHRRLSRLDASDVELAPRTTPIATALEQIESSTERMVNLINELVDVTRVQMGAVLELDRRPIDLVALVRAAVAQQEGVAPGRVHLETALTELAGMVDAERVERVIGNLLSNAIKYSPRDSAISVRLTREGGTDGLQAVIAVRDEGIGIPAGDLPYVFERFHRAANVAGHIQGTGIGLASAREIVERHGGTISAESTEGAGSTFTVRLPLG